MTVSIYILFMLLREFLCAYKSLYCLFEVLITIVKVLLVLLSIDFIIDKAVHFSD